MHANLYSTLPKLHALCQFSNRTLPLFGRRTDSSLTLKGYCKVIGTRTTANSFAVTLSLESSTFCGAVRLDELVRPKNILAKIQKALDDRDRYPSSISKGSVP